ncbi:hypothetical protein [Foetidibacter luteolus]|uniref:hypothetical protein n=1 Tax=Foetidibacter luteolus TaxID=2608880 RepID=UPI00129AFC7B|nr:hypothetical protein [Foetidibacter luteolus]
MKRLFSFLSLCLLLFACSKEKSDQFISDPYHPQNDTTWSAGIAATAPVNQLIQALAAGVESDSLDVSIGGTLHFSNNCTIKFPAKCFKGSVAGKVKVELIFLDSKGDMLRFSKPTVSDGRVLVSGGAFYINVTQNGQQLELDNKRISIRYTVPSPENNMSLFYGDTSVNSNDGFNWVPAEDTAVVWRQEDSSGIEYGYELLSPKFGWINCDRFSDTSMPRTKLVSILPVNFTNKNTAVFAVFKDQWSVLRLYANPSNRYFYADNIPVGSNVTLVSISKIGDDFYLGSKSIKVAVDKAEEFTPQKVTKDQLIAFIETL